MTSRLKLKKKKKYHPPFDGHPDKLNIDNDKSKDTNMSVLKLINNTGLKTERNLCYVNASLQLLHSIPDVRKFFKNKEYRLNYLEHLPVSDEIARIFATEGKFCTTTAELRRLIAHFHGRMDIWDGSQQDLEEFHRMLLEALENELSHVGFAASRFLSKFCGMEQNKKKFINTNNVGHCKEGHVARIEEEQFKMIKLDVPLTGKELSLNNMIDNHFSENPNTILMKCSDCCLHTTNCPQSGKCKLKEAVSQKCLLSTPTFLYIQLLRFDYYQNPKIETLVMPENVLVLPNGDKYKLVSIANHLGTLIENGHYQALVKRGTSWIKCDDNTAFKTNKDKEINGTNYIFVYQKYNTKATLFQHTFGRRF